MAYDVAKLLSMSQADLDALFTQSAPGDIPDGEAVRQETRLWDAGRGVTAPMRSKEEAHDYRYFPEPDLKPLILSDAWIAGVRDAMPELPAALEARIEATYGIPAYDARVLSA